MRKVRFGQKPRGRTFPFLKNATTKQSCLLCLEEMTTKQRMNYSTNVCDCKPRIHDHCFDQWDKRYPGSCPICRKEGTVFLEPNPEVKSVPVVSSGSDDMGGFCCILGCWSIIDFMSTFTN